MVIPYVVNLSPYISLPGPDLARDAFPEVFGDVDRPVVLYLGRLNPKKGVELLIQSAADLCRRGLDFAVAVAGTGKRSYEDSLRELASEVGVSDRLHFLGFVFGETKVSLFQAADVFVLPTSQENWGLVLTESLACGTPVITTKGVDIWAELQSSGAAVIVDSTRTAIAAALAELLQNKAKREAMQQKGRAWVLQNLNVDRVARQYEALYQSVAQRAVCA